MVAAVVERLESFNPQISTPAHVKWLMEVIAQGFTLNMEDLPVIERCVTIYTKWLLGGPEDKPPGLLAEETFFRGVRINFAIWRVKSLFEPLSNFTYYLAISPIIPSSSTRPSFSLL